ncbi:peptidase [Renibacterium salmoninarum ATCC 33209]|uniref:Peptidase n=1 Tax=Renibacterium salmoninarum (strain ATCC 33209 / DSM 20767 / JCM 11484 / NBRC 15589 / NCIMB 2235) TaxID=288705 RepID=A9WTM0_RENSM|nr:peptidase [Renibacterium salmoninarum]ABY24541.1 peptidase [Renibacterium salmoninarum ATCC 33209]
MTLSADGRRLVTTVASLDSKSTAYRNALWEIDPQGVTPARRLTRSAKGESSAAFSQDGRLLFTSARPDPEADSEESIGALWELPGEAGEARLLHVREGGMNGFTANTSSARILLNASVLPGAADEEADAEAKSTQRTQDFRDTAFWLPGSPLGSRPRTRPTQAFCAGR